MYVETSTMLRIPSLFFILPRFVYQSECIKGRNHKKLKAGGENNIIRDYFHSSAGFSPYTKATRMGEGVREKLSLDYRFFQLVLFLVELVSISFLS